MPLSSPLDITNCRVWLDISDLTTLSGLSAGTIEEGNSRPVNTNDYVGFINDKSNNNNNFTNFFGSTGTRPILIASSQNNRSFLRFNGLNYLTGLFTLPISAQTTFAVVSRRLAPNSGVGRVYTQTDGGSDTRGINHYIPIVIDGNSNFSSYISGAYRSSILPPMLSSFDVYTSVFSANQLSGFVFNYLGGLSATSSVASPVRRTSSLYNILCSRIGAGFASEAPDTLPTAFTYLTGDIGEIIVYDRFLTREERTSVEWYLANKWNLPLTFFAINSGNWSNDSIWSVSGTPLPKSDVFSNGYIITINQDITARGILGIHSSPVNTRNTNGIFLLLSAYNITTTLSGIRAGSNTGLYVENNSTNNLFISGNVIGGTTANAFGISLSSMRGDLTIFGDISGGTNSSAYGLIIQNDPFNLDYSNILNIRGSIYGVNASGVFNDSNKTISVTGDLIRGGTVASSFGINNYEEGNLYVNSNIIGGSIATSYGINNRRRAYVSIVGSVSASLLSEGVLNSADGTAEIQGNIVASMSRPAFVSPSSRGVNIISGNVYNSIRGTQAIVAVNLLFKNKVPNMGTSFDRRQTVTNLLSSSEIFTTPVYTQPFAPVTVTPNTWYTPTNPSVLEATLINTTNNTGIFTLRRDTPSLLANTVYTYSVFASPKPGNTGNLELFLITPSYSTSFIGYGGVFDINNGNTLSLSLCTLSAISSFDSDTDFRRYSITFINSKAGAAISEIRITTSSSLSQHVAGDTTQGFYIWGAQLSQSRFLDGYVSNTESTPTTLSKTYSPSRIVGEGPDTFKVYESNNFSISNLPSENNVRSNIKYGGYTPLGIPTTLQGNMVVPSKVSVKYGTLVDNTYGNAILDARDAVKIWDVLTSSINVNDSIGARIKNISSTFDVGSALNTMNI